MKPETIRKALDLSMREAGESLLGLEGQNAYDTWRRIERTGKYHASTGRYFDLLLYLIEDDKGMILLEKFRNIY